jgi:PiT family inorganic phosphate transporter
MAHKSTLDKDLKKFVRLEEATHEAGLSAVKLGLALLFLLAVLVYVVQAVGGLEGQILVIVAAVIGGYMALNIGANDVANNMGPAVGSAALTMLGALAIAAVFEAAGAILAGGDVVSTISKGIIDPAAMPDAQTFTWAMMAALLSAAIWLNLATYVGAPVSTTHAIVGGVLGAGLAAAGATAVNWPIMAAIAASWVISPLLGAIIASIFLAGIKFLIIFKDDKVAAARRWVPFFVAIMAAVFSMYLVMKGLKRVWRPGPEVVVMIGVAVFALGFALVKPLVVRAAARLENTRKSVSSLFTVPLICSTALLSFAHGSNDVANAVGPLAAVVSAVSSGGIAAKVAVPTWVMVVGALGISAGLLLFGPKLVRTVGQKITKLDRVRAFTVALSAAITVLLASALGLPVSTTHIAVGAVFGVGFFREYLVNRRKRDRAAAAEPLAAKVIFEGPLPDDPPAEDSSAAEGAPLTKKEKKKLKKARKRRLVRRAHLYTILAAWLITVPMAAVFGAFFFFTFRGMLLH